ncbi:DUF4177 domain-containing protein [Pseudoxanthomonas dokdonensis]|uniref:DUF4177 domain-containing protein n=1 Tax=Pseudoxanthomonas dokdonensis TaxID=344882 RepID=UPI0009F88CAA|nr:DUF4177 domain-containing protein [Pseudoxanthomonas dokdonensis]
MSKRWEYQVIEVKPGMLGGFRADAIQEELTRHGKLGWELVNLVSHPMQMSLLVFKREA